MNELLKLIEIVLLIILVVLIELRSLYLLTEITRNSDIQKRNESPVYRSILKELAKKYLYIENNHYICNGSVWTPVRNASRMYIVLPTELQKKSSFEVTVVSPRGQMRAKLLKIAAHIDGIPYNMPIGYL